LTRLILYNILYLEFESDIVCAIEKGGKEASGRDEG
jgi:hypothetical protein